MASRETGPLAQFDPEGEIVDGPTFEQILEMDDDEDERDFSRGIVYGFFDQADQTFNNMDAALEKKDLPELSSLGHFLKGSSATLGLIKVRDSCEKIQHYGAGKDESGSNPTHFDDAHNLKLIEKTIEQVKDEYKTAEGVLRRFYGEKVG